MYMKRMYKSLIFTLCLSVELFAQYGSVGSYDARSMGMAKTYTATSRGINSIGINPANLMYSENGHFEFSTILPLPTTSVRSGTDFLSIEDFNYYFGGVDGHSRYLNDQDKERLNNLFKNGGDVFLNASTRIFSATWKINDKIGALGFSISDFMGGYMKIPQALIEIPLYGNTIEQVYSFSEANIKSWWLRDYSISYAREIPNSKFFKNLFAGITLKYINGFYYVGTNRVNTSLETNSRYEILGTADMIGYSSFSQNFGVNYDFDSTEYQSSFSPFPSPAGNGFGMDLGLSASLSPVLNVSFAVTDLGTIKWNERAAKYSALGDIYVNDISNKDQIDSLGDKITGKGEYISDFTTTLPTALRFGASYLMNSGIIPGTLLVGLDYNQGLNDFPGNSIEARFSIGAEWKPMDWIPYIRTGLSFGGWAGFNWAFGLGINAGLVELNFATSDMNSLVAPNSAKHLSVSFGSRWKFD
jgi:Family of unknown function (DUF5723)